MTKLKTILVSEATNIQLDWLVAKAQEAIELEDEDGKYWVVGNKFLSYRHGYHPSEAWINGGPIIERERISLKENVPAYPDNLWNAFPSITAKGAGWKWGVGPTPLIAAMRCFVMSKLGNRVEIPEEL